MSSTLRLVLGALSIALGTGSALAQTTWTGATSTDWGTASNWTAGIPTSSDDAIIAPAANNPSTSGATAECQDLTVQSSATLDIAVGFPLTVHGGATTSGTINGGLMLFVGSGTIQSVSLASYPDVDISGTYTMPTTRIDGSFRHLAVAGALTMGNVTLESPATFSGSTILWTGAGFTEFRDDVTFQTTGIITNPPLIIFRGSTWTSNANFASTSGEVIFGGPNTATVNATGSSWNAVRIGLGAQITFTSSLLTLGQIRVDGQMTLGPAATNLESDGGLRIDPTGSLVGLSTTSVNLTSGNITIDGSLNTPLAVLDVVGSWDSAGSVAIGGAGNTHTFDSGVSVTGPFSVDATSTFLFRTSLSFAITGGPFTNVQVSNQPNIDGITVNGTFEQLATARGLVFGTTPSVIHGTATFNGTTLSGSTGTLTLNGDVTFATTAPITAPPPIVFNGTSWISNANFNPISGTVTLSGAAQSVTAQTLSLPTLTVEPGSTTTLAIENLTVATTLTVNGAMTTPTTSLQVQQSLVVGGTGQLTVNPGTHTVAGNYTNNGTTTGAGTLMLTGAGNWSGSGTHGNVEVASSGTVTVTSGVAAANVSVSTGTLEVTGTNTLAASGNVNLTGGALQGPAAATFDIEGNTTLSGTVAGTTVPTIRCAGDLTADPTFAPTSGTVWLDGSAPSEIRAATSGGAIRFFNLQMDNGVRNAGNPFNIQGTAPGSAAGVCAAATFNIGSQPIEITQCFNFVVEGGMTVNTGGSVAFDGDSSIMIQPIGTMRMLGSPGTPACVVGANGGGYSLTVAGTLEASHFEFRQMAPTGIRIEASATLPTFANGLFAEGSPQPGSALLEIAQSAPITLREINFENTGSTATFNARSAGTPPGIITFEDYGGTFGGPAFEDDPNGVLEWTTPGRTTVPAFTSSGGVGRVELTFTTTQEIGTVFFHVSRGTTPIGPFVPIGAPIAPAETGSGSSYSLTDTSVVHPTSYYYRLDEERAGGERRALATDFARPLPASGQLGGSYFVGAGGFADIGAALAAAPAGTTVLVSAGTYPPFSITQPTRVIGTGGVVIDTSTGPVVVHDVVLDPANRDVVLSGLDLGGASSPNGLQIVNVDAVTVLDELTVTVMPGVDSIRLDDAPRVAVQNCDLQGGTGLRVQNTSVAYLSSGTTNELHVETGSTVTHAGVTPGTTNVDGSSTVNSLTGTVPRVGFPHGWPSGKTAPISVNGDANDAWAIVLSIGKSWLTLEPLGYDMIMLQDPVLLRTLAAGLLPGGGTTAFDFPVPDLGASAWGISLPLQVVRLDLGSGGRFGNVRDPVILP